MMTTLPPHQVIKIVDRITPYLHRNIISASILFVRVFIKY